MTFDHHKDLVNILVSGGGGGSFEGNGPLMGSGGKHTLIEVILCSECTHRWLSHLSMKYSRSLISYNLSAMCFFTFIQYVTTLWLTFKVTLFIKIKYMI